MLGRTHKVPSSLPPTGGADWAGASGLSMSGRSTDPRVAVQGAVSESGAWNSPGTDGPASACAAATRSSSPTPISRSSGRPAAGITGDIVTFSHPDDTKLPRAKGKASRDGHTLLPSSLDDAFVLDGPGRVRGQGGPPDRRPHLSRRRQGRRGRQAGRLRRRARRPPHHPPRRHRPPPVARRSSATSAPSTSPACRSAARSARPAPRRSSPSSTRASWSPMPLCEDEADCAEALAKFFHEMGAEPTTQPKLSVTLLEPAGRRRRWSCSSRAASRSDRGAGAGRGHGRSRTTRPALDDGADEVRGRPVGDLGRRRDAPDREVGGLAGLERADLVGEPERLGGIDRDRAQDLVRAHAQARRRRRSSPAAGSPWARSRD